MKRRLLITLFLAAVPLVLAAQENSTDTLRTSVADPLQMEDSLTVPVQLHLSFMGNPIDGPVRDFVGKLSRRNFSVELMSNELCVLDGSFAGYDGSKAFVYAHGGTVWGVVVTLPAHDTWASMQKEYRLFKKALTTKYFVQPRSIERFPAHIPEGSGREHEAFREDTAVYQSVFSLPSGSITIAVTPVLDGVGRFFLKLEYKDELNSMIRTSAFMEDL